MINDIYNNILENKDLRKNLIELKAQIKDDSNKYALLYRIAGDYNTLIGLLKNDDPKVRKNAALIMGILDVKGFLVPLYDAYVNETQLFVKSSYLTAIMNYDYRVYLNDFKERLNYLSKSKVEDNDKKHIDEEIRQLTNLVVTMEGVRKHKFIGYDVENTLVLLTNRNHFEQTFEQVESNKKKRFNAGVIVKTTALEDVLKIRTFEELLFMVPLVKQVENDPMKAADAIIKGDILGFLTSRHNGKAPFYFRVEMKSKLELDKKSIFAKKFASQIQRLSQGKLINSTSNYEFEIRLILNKDGKYNVLLKLFTLNDDRFSYRSEAIATSIKPVNAALTMSLVKEYLKEGAKVMDPFCGVGTMLIERSKFLKANTLYGVDIFGEGIDKARVNTENAKEIVHYINRDFFDFRHEYLFDEIVTDMPFNMANLDDVKIKEIYIKFFEKARTHLVDGGLIIMYCHNKEYIKRFADKKYYRVIDNFEISMRENAYVYVIKYNESI